jgi:hypothetical protein
MGNVEGLVEGGVEGGGGTRWRAKDDRWARLEDGGRELRISFFFTSLGELRLFLDGLSLVLPPLGTPSVLPLTPLSLLLLGLLLLGELGGHI